MGDLLYKAVFSVIDSQEDIVCISTTDSLYSDEHSKVLVSESEYYTNDILLRSPTLQPYVL
jgi:hypothetical protein